MTYKPDWADRLAASTKNIRGKNSWEYEHPINAWESMPWFIRWPLAVMVSLYFGGAFLIGLVGLFRF